MKIGKEWLSISDMMAGLMMVFLFISVSLMYELQKDDKKVSKIKEQLKQEFEKNLIEFTKNKNVTIKTDDRGDTIISFKNHHNENTNIEEAEYKSSSKDNILFDSGKSDVKNEFKNILKDFYPKYIEILISKEYKQYIKEIKIEGHTDSTYIGENGDGYIHNIQLSQQRSSNVLEYLSSLDIFEKNKKWLKERTRANGVGSAVLIKDKSGTENRKASRRVNFRVTIGITE